MKPPILKLMVVSLCLGLAVVLTVNYAAAQDLGSLGKQAQSFGGLGDISGLAQKLHLSPQQVQQVMPILQNEVPKLMGIKNNTNLTNQQKVTETKQVQQQSDSKLKSMLSPEQFTSLKNFRSMQLQDVVGQAAGAIPH
jgi:hypothetical protein